MYTSPRLEICGLSIGSGYHDGDGRVHRRWWSTARHTGPSQRGCQRLPPSTIVRLMYCLATLRFVAKDDVRRCQHQFPHSECILANRAQADSRALGRQPPCRPLCQHPAAPPVQPCPLRIPGERPRIPASPLCSRCCTEVQLHQHRQRTMRNSPLSTETPDTAATRCTGSRK